MIQNVIRTNSRPPSLNQEKFNKIDIIALRDSDPSLNEMKFRLDNFKKEVDESIKSNKPIINETFKKNFFYL